ncbi:MAG: threonylcarbamoyl-AMP synthase [Deltaproteobacteria bacterium]|nr:threonylcarbamoyl-AMP synthase [Deltaproteobacteria bacterium]
MLLDVNPNHPQPRKIGQAVEVLRAGGVIIYPTDTFYGIGCDLFNKKAIERIYQIKRRPKTKPFSFICADLKDIAQYAIVSNYAYKTMRRFLPGPYTFVLKGTKQVPRMMLNNRKMVGIRVPDDSVALSLVAALGHPIISTSATIDSEDIISDASLLADHLGHSVDLVVDGGPRGFEPSSVISLIDDQPVVLRQGKGEVSFFGGEDD